MATVKILDLPFISTLQANTANTVLVGVDVPGDFTGQMTLTTLANGLYSNNYLMVGNNDIAFADAIGQFHGNASPYLQVVLHNEANDGSGDFVVTADTGTDTTHYVDMGIQGSTLSQGVLLPLDSYLISVGDTSTTPGGNLIVGTDTPDRNIDIILGGHESDNVVAQFLYGSGFKLTQKPLIFADGTSQNSAVAYTGVDSRISSNVATINGSITSNVSTINGSITSNVATINGSITSNIATANLFTQSAFDKANNALANTSGTFGGNLTISGNVTVTGQTSSTGPITTGNLIVAGTTTLTGNVVMDATTYMTGAVTVNSTMLLANSNFSATEAALTISASPSVVTPANDGYMIHISGKNGVASRIVTDSYGTGAYALYTGRAARGTVTSPTAIQANDVIARYSSSGYGATKYQTLGTGRIDFVANENYTDANTGSRIEFWNCPTGSNTLNRIATFNGESVTFTGSVEPMKGFVYTPLILSGNQTSITVNFATDSIVRATFNSTLTVAFSNYTYGKIVDIWVTNTAGNGQTINLGVSSNNSTTGSSTLSVAAGRSAKLQYFSIDGDNSNTFVAITYA